MITSPPLPTPIPDDEESGSVAEPLKSAPFSSAIPSLPLIDPYATPPSGEPVSKSSPFVSIQNVPVEGASLPEGTFSDYQY